MLTCSSFRMSMDVRKLHKHRQISGGLPVMWNPAVPGMEDAHICAVLSFRRIRRYPVLPFKTAEKHVRFTGWLTAVECVLCSNVCLHLNTCSRVCGRTTRRFRKDLQLIRFPAIQIHVIREKVFRLDRFAVDIFDRIAEDMIVMFRKIF